MIETAHDHGNCAVCDQLAEEAARCLSADIACQEAATAEIERLQARVATLEAALRRYGQHDPYTCAQLGRPDWRCTCGLDAALAPPSAGGA